MNLHQRCLPAEVKNQNESVQFKPKSQDLSRSLEVELAWRSGSVMDCLATVRVRFPVGTVKKTSYTSFARDSK